MHLTPTATLVMDNVAVATSIPNIYLGAIGGCGSNKYAPDWFAWFEDRPVCSGTDLGPITIYPNPQLKHGLCDKTVTLENYANVTFTGCAKAPSPLGDAGPPTGVSVDGIPVLACNPVDMQATTICESFCSGSAVAVATRLFCSRLED